MGENIKKKFARRLATVRKKKHLTQQQLAELADLDYKHIQLLESSKAPAPRLDTLEKLAKALKLSLHQLLRF